MALFDKKASPVSDVLQLRQQGLTDDIIIEELSQRGYPQQQISEAIAQADSSSPAGYGPSMPGTDQMPMMPQEMPSLQPSYQEDMSNIYERMQEIAEAMIDEKWDDLIGEVKKIIEWKNKNEEKQSKLQHDVDKLKEDFKMLHEAVLGKLEDYDARMRDVGTELKAVGKVFKDVIPTFVDNVKELSSVKEELKKRHSGHK
ncbi:hypothetical protein HY494_01780 [Candidatus Woesearchaeota archaeon]|nr:hypothetical protein [Candidatus Woesearchaeota archaeon]